MKLLGLIGGISPESTAIYYQLLNEQAQAQLGGQHSANILLYTVDYGVVYEQYQRGDWDGYAGEIVKAAKRLKAAGADFLAIASNTSHIGAAPSAAETGLPVLHVLDALVDSISAAGVKRPLLLGTPFVMAGDFYRAELAKRFSGEALTPNVAEQKAVGRIIFDELVNGDVLDGSREELKRMVARSNCDGVILGCTELCMILSQDDFEMPVFDTTGLHAAALASYMFEER
ncbi:MAG: amino acid racemase [Pseudomonadota bacterium]